MVIFLKKHASRKNAQVWHDSLTNHFIHAISVNQPQLRQLELQKLLVLDAK